MSRIAWVLVIALVVLALLAVGLSFITPMMGRGFGFGFGMMRPGPVTGVAWPFLLIRGLGMLLFWLLIIIGVVWLIRSVAGAAAASSIPPTFPEPPLDILKRRYAKGEITKDQYEEMKQALTS